MHIDNLVRYVKVTAKVSWLERLQSGSQLENHFVECVCCLKHGGPFTWDKSTKSVVCVECFTVWEVRREGRI
jgi:hypothetical protein